MNAETIREMSDDAIRTEIDKLDKELMDMRMKNSIGNLENPVQLRFRRKDLARLKTILSEREAK